MNKLKKVLLILFVFIITLVIIIALNKTDVISEIVEVAESETLASSTTSVTSFRSSTQDISSVEKNKTTIDGETYYYIGTIEGGETSTETRIRPPSKQLVGSMLFRRPCHEESYSLFKYR